MSFLFQQRRPVRASPPYGRGATLPKDRLTLPFHPARSISVGQFRSAGDLVLPSGRCLGPQIYLPLTGDCTHPERMGCDSRHKNALPLSKTPVLYAAHKPMGACEFKPVSLDFEQSSACFR